MCIQFPHFVNGKKERERKKLDNSIFFLLQKKRNKRTFLSLRSFQEDKILVYFLKNITAAKFVCGASKIWILSEFKLCLNFDNSIYFLSSD